MDTLRKRDTTGPRMLLGNPGCATTAAIRMVMSTGLTKSVSGDYASGLRGGTVMV